MLHHCCLWPFELFYLHFSRLPELYGGKNLLWNIYIYAKGGKKDITYCQMILDSTMWKKAVILLSAIFTASAAGSDSSCQLYSDLPHTTEVYRHGDVCYQFVHEERYWTSARSYCSHVSTTQIL